MELYQWFGVALAVMGGLWGAYRWFIGRDDKHRTDVNSAQDRTLEAHQSRLDRHREQLNRLDDLIQATREEMSRNYVRLEHIEKLERSLDNKMDQLHKRLSGIARDLNQAIGNMRAMHDGEITHLVEQIRDAIKHKPGN